MATASKKRKTEEAIAALLVCDSLAAAASKVGVSKSTLQRWLREPDFRNQYREARQATLDSAIGRLHENSSGAVSALLAVLADSEAQASVKIQAAQAVLSWSVRLSEIVDIDERLAALEAAAKLNNSNNN